MHRALGEVDGNVVEVRVGNQLKLAHVQLLRVRIRTLTRPPYAHTHIHTHTATTPSRNNHFRLHEQSVFLQSTLPKDYSSRASIDRWGQKKRNIPNATNMTASINRKYTAYHYAARGGPRDGHS